MPRRPVPGFVGLANAVAVFGSSFSDSQASQQFFWRYIEPAVEYPLRQQFAVSGFPRTDTAELARAKSAEPVACDIVAYHLNEGTSLIIEKAK